MLVSTLVFVTAVLFLAGVAAIARAVRTVKVEQRSPASNRLHETKLEDPDRVQGSFEPVYCYNDCVRVHQGLDPSFPCSVACNIGNGSVS